MHPTAAVYVIPYDIFEIDHALLALQRLRAAVDRLVIVVTPSVQKRFSVEIDSVSADRTLPFDASGPVVLAGYRTGLSALREMAGEAGPGTVIVTGSHVFGPLLSDGSGSLPAALDLNTHGLHVRAAWWHATTLDARMKDETDLPRMALLDYAIFAPDLTAHPAFWAYWDGLRPKPDRWQDTLGFTRMIRDAGLTMGFFLPEAAGETTEPAIYEVHKLIANGVPCLPIAAFNLDPVIQDLNATVPRAALDDLRRVDPPMYAAVIRFLTRHMQMRDLTTVTDQYEVLAEQAAGDPDRPRAFGTPAIFIHAFYATMMPEFWALIERLPKDRHLFLTTASETDRDAIRAYLAERGEKLGATPQDDLTIPDGVTATVRVVEQNRGRDMASLFITWRDVVLSGRYEVALRLHSKRTPQVSRQVGESFKAHLFDNLVASKGYVSNLLDRMEAEPDIGLVIPPLIHIGFGTLGHSWFANKWELHRLIQKIGIDVPLDEYTPVAPNGTMYWFRTQALAIMFETPWKWEDYNAEPNHIDGGLAHVQERLIGYAAQEKGFRVLQVMTPGAAARGYARLEYKLQLLASQLATGNIWQQREQMRELAGGSVRMRIYRSLIRSYGRILVRYPGARNYLAPTGHRIARLLGAKRP